MTTSAVNLEIYLTNGFNAKAFDFIGWPVFTVSYSSGTQVSLGLSQQIYNFPDDVLFNGGACFSSFSDDAVVQSDSDYRQKFSFGVSAGGKIKRLTMGAEASISSHISADHKLVHSTTQQHFFSWAVQTIYQFERTAAPTVTSAFTAAIGKLPAPPATAADWQQYYDFFDQYGTHYLLRGSLGGYFYVQTDIAKELVQSETAAAITSELSASFNAAVASGTTKIDGGLEAGNFLKDNIDKLSSRYGCRGGLFSTDLTAWSLSCFHNPILVPGIKGINEPIIRPLWDLAAASSVQAPMAAAFRRYMAGGRVFGPQQPVTLGLSQTAATSGFVSAAVVSGTSGGTTQWIIQASNGSSPMVAAQAAAGWPKSTYLCPVNSNQSYVCSVNLATPTAVANFTPVFSPAGEGDCFEAPVAVQVAKITQAPQYQPAATLPPIKTPWVAPADGILLCTGTQWMAVLYGGVAGSEAMAACSINGVTPASQNCSFAAPVFGGAAYQLSIQGPVGAPDFVFYGLKNLRWGQPRQCELDTIYSAASDGLAVGVLGGFGLPVPSSGSAPPPVLLDLLVNDSSEPPGPTRLSGAASISDLAAWGSVTLPVCMGQRFSASVSSKPPTGAVATLTWYPFEFADPQAIVQKITRPG